MQQFNLTAESSFRTSPKYSFTSFVSPADRIKPSPGPGAYGPPAPADRDKFRKSASWTIGGASTRLEKSVVSLTPGPGQYKLDLNDSGQKAIFSCVERLKTRRANTAPGPGQYQVDRMDEGRASSIYSRNAGAGKASTVPGPGAYKPSFACLSQMEALPKVSFGASCRAELSLSKTPGPGSYDHECYKNCMKNSLKYSISARCDVPEKPDKGPGPIAPHTQFQ